MMLRSFQPRLAARLLTGIIVALSIPSACAADESVTTETRIACNREITVAAVHCAATGLGAILKDQRDDNQRIQTIRTFIDPVRFFPDQSGYFYVYDSKCVNIAHAVKHEIQGTSLYDHKDTKGKFVIRELQAAAKAGGGFVEFYWDRPGAKGEQRKLGYVEPVPNTDYFIGSGVYLPGE